jgi:transcriptional regulator with XRE-family HTH domain
MAWARIVGGNVRQLRQARGLTQEALADEAKVALRLLGGIERGQRNPTVEMIGRIATALGVHPRELFDDASAG